MDTNRPGFPATPSSKIPAPGVSASTPRAVGHADPGITPQPAIPSKIQHNNPSLLRQSGSGLEESIKPVTRLADEARPLPVADRPGTMGISGKITAFGKERRHEDSWSRTPNTTGHGAIHVKTFHCKLTEDAVAYMDQSINEWLDAHPQYEVKFVSSTIGTLTGKLKEPALFCQVWV